MKQGLVLVDIQNDYFPGGRMELVGMKDAAGRAATLLDAFREADQPRFHIQHVFESADAPFFAPGTDGIGIHETVAPVEGESVVRKSQVNGFRGTDLLERIKDAGVEQLVVCGAMSHMCIEATTRAAADYGLDCVVVHDACATTDLEFQGRKIPAAEVHGASMAALGFAYAKVVDLSGFGPVK